MDEDIWKLNIINEDAMDSSETNENPWDKLDDVMAETVLARLPTMEILLCQFVCKRWKSIILCSPTFSITSKQLFKRGPWFFLYNSYRSSSNAVFYDTEVSNWRRVHLPRPRRHEVKYRPIASSGELICIGIFKTKSYSLIVKNPITRASHCLPDLKTFGIIRGVAMHTSKSESGMSYKIFVVFGRNWPNLVMKVFSSEDNNWRDVTMLPEEEDYEESDWIPSEELVGMTTIGNEGQILVHYLDTCTGLMIRFDTLEGTFSMSPRSSYNFATMGLVECHGRVFAMVIKQRYVAEYITLHVWEFDDEEAEWEEITVLQFKWSKHIKVDEVLLRDCYGMECKLTCAGHGDYIMVCLNFKVFSIAPGHHLNHVLMYNIKENSWADLPPCLDPKENQVQSIRFWPYCFEPEIGGNV